MKVLWITKIEHIHKLSFLSSQCEWFVISSENLSNINNFCFKSCLEQLFTLIDQPIAVILHFYCIPNILALVVGTVFQNYFWFSQGVRWSLVKITPNNFCLQFSISYCIWWTHVHVHAKYSSKIVAIASLLPFFNAACCMSIHSKLSTYLSTNFTFVKTDLREEEQDSYLTQWRRRHVTTVRGSHQLCETFDMGGRLSKSLHYVLCKFHLRNV